jgi:gamma-glutamyltranspeptidase/glutathione hydrolase
VADARGGAVALSTTLNRSFGCRKVAAGTGILLNDEMDDFALAPGLPNTWGLVGGEANAVAGSKRPLSSMTPTIVELAEPGPRPLLVLGSPGGARIITAVLQVLVNGIDHEMPLQEAVDAPRFHHQWLPDVLLHERRAFAADVSAALERRGHRLEAASGYLGNVNAIGLDRASGHWLGAADPRREGSARGF